MPSPEGHTMTTLEKDTNAEKEDHYGTTTPPDSEDEKAEQPEPVQEPDRDRGEEAAETEEGSGGDGGQDQAPPEPVTDAGDIPKILGEIRSIRDELQKSVSKKEEDSKTQQQPLTDDQWSQIEEQWGGMDRKQIQAVTNYQLQNQKQLLADMNSKLAKFEKESVLQELSTDPKFSDATKYRNEINEFLGHYAPEHHSNKDVLIRAIHYARGKTMDNTIKRVQNNKERNRKIVGSARPSTPAAGRKEGSAYTLSKIEQSAARAVGMSDEEYIKIKTQQKKTFE